MLYTKYESSMLSSFGEEELCSYVQNCEPRGRASFEPLGIICTNLVEIHKMLLTKYQYLPVPEKNFEDGLLCSYVSTCDPPGWGQF